ncbi:MAG: LytTR family DNA-binding domain-containing protein [bacterium]
MKIRTVIVEDERPAMERMRNLLANFPDIEIIGEAEDGLSAVKLISNLQPDLVFLDIRLPELSGFQVLEKVTNLPKVIFVTAYDEYAIKAFEANAVDYLLKPTSVERVKKTIDKVKSMNDRIEPQLLSLLKGMVEKNKYMQNFSVKVKDEILLIPAEVVHWFYASDKYVFLRTFDTEYFLDLTLKRLDELLDPEKFVRIHKSVIVSATHINKIKKSFTGKYMVVMTDSKKTSLEIGRTYLPVLKERFHF